jgi:GNAT superfamily N-acetyltransferase
MTLSITPIHHADAAAIQSWVDVVSAVLQKDLPDFPLPDATMTRLVQQHPFPGRQVEHYLVRSDGEAVGRLEIQFNLLENLNNAMVSIDIIPAHRRQGIGRAVLDFAVDRARAEGRTNIMGTTCWNRPETATLDEAGVRFAEAAGGTPALADVQRRLRLADIDEQSLTELRAHALAKAAGYRIVTWRGPSPDEWVNDIAYLDGRMFTDAPTGDLELEAEKIDGQRVKASEQVIAARRRETWHTGAVHEESGRLVAWTVISKDETLDWHAWQQITIADPDHRGHRLGLLVKVENLRFFRSDQPAVAVVDTFNAADNSYMISINEQMGFRPLYAYQNWQLKV